METILVILIPAILSGLGFVSYKHPNVALKLITVISVVSTAIFMFFTIYLDGKTSAFNESRQATNISIYKYERQLWDSKNIKLSPTNMDSIENSYIINNKIDSLKSEIKNNETILRDSIKAKISIISDDVDITKSKTIKYFALVMATLIIFLYLSYTFHKLWQQEKKENKN